MIRESLSAMLITYNEENNIQRTLASLQWLTEVLIIDSGSTDQTLEIASHFPNTRIISRKFDTFANQCNFGLDHASTSWILSLDADYVVSSALRSEIEGIFANMSTVQGADVDAYKISFIYCINGKPVRCGLLPARISLYKRRLAQYKDEGHGHRVVINGTCRVLKNKLLHDDRKPLSVWLKSQKKYQAVEAEMLLFRDSKSLPIQDLIRKHTFLAPFLSFFVCIVLKGGILDGKEGLIYAFQRLIAESLLYLNMHVKDRSSGS